MAADDRYRLAENNNFVQLAVQRARPDDSGLYTLLAKNAAGEARATLELQVEGRSPAKRRREDGVTGEGSPPTFVRSLNDLAVKVGTRTRLLVELRGASNNEGNFFCLDVSPVVAEDGGLWTCRAFSETGREIECSCYLNVLVPKAYKPPEFVEELRALLTEQGTVSLECKVVGVPTPVLRWFKDGREIRAGDVFALTASLDDPTSLGTYTCEASNCMGKTYSSSRVHVLGASKSSSASSESLCPAGPPPLFIEELRNEKAKLGDPLSLTCRVRVPPWPKEVAWYNSQGRVDTIASGGTGSATSIAPDKYRAIEDGLGRFSLQISGIDLVDQGEWKCVVTSQEGVKSMTHASISVTVPKNYRKPRFLDPLKAILTEEGLVSFECKVVGFPTPQLRWFKDGQELRPGDVYQLSGTNSLGSYSCIAQNCMGEASSGAELTLEDIQSQLSDEERRQLLAANQPPRFVRGLKSAEARILEPHRLTIQVTVSPEPRVAWYRDDELVESGGRYVATRDNAATYTTNDFGQSVTSCFLKLIIPRHFKKPRFLENLRAILSEEGAVNLECKVIGVPQPQLKWYKDGVELKPGDIHRIISGQDGSCCLGTYTCEASNCMGVVASSASLLGFEERMSKNALESTRKMAQQLQPLATMGTSGAAAGGDHRIARDPSLSTIHEERTSQMVDHGDRSIANTIADEERAEVSFSFDGREVSVSLYETPDLTEEEALQIVEMYAEELSEHVSEHNIVELPSLRFVKETSTSGKLVMEAVVIDVTDEAFETALAANASADDERTDADLDNLSITDEIPDGVLPQDKLTTDFLERAFSPPSQKDDADNVPKPPPRSHRKPLTPVQQHIPDDNVKSSDDSFYSMAQKENESAATGNKSVTESLNETFASAKTDLSENKKKKKGELAYQVAAMEIEQAQEPNSKEDGMSESKRRKSSRSRSSSIERKKKSRSKENESPTMKQGNVSLITTSADQTKISILGEAPTEYEKTQLALFASKANACEKVLRFLSENKKETPASILSAENDLCHGLKIIENVTMAEVLEEKLEENSVLSYLDEAKTSFAKAQEKIEYIPNSEALVYMQIAKSFEQAVQLMEKHISSQVDQLNTDETEMSALLEEASKKFTNALSECAEEKRKYHSTEALKCNEETHLLKCDFSLFEKELIIESGNIPKNKSVNFESNEKLLKAISCFQAGLSLLSDENKQECITKLREGQSNIDECLSLEIKDIEEKATPIKYSVVTLEQAITNCTNVEESKTISNSLKAIHECLSNQNVQNAFADASKKAQKGEIKQASQKIMESSLEIQKGLAMIELEAALEFSSENSNISRLACSAQKLQRDLTKIKDDGIDENTNNVAILQNIATSSQIFQEELLSTQDAPGILSKTFNALIETTKEFCNDVAQAIQDIVINKDENIIPETNVNPFETLQRGLLEVTEQLEFEAKDFHASQNSVSTQNLQKQLSEESPLHVLAESTRQLQKAVIEKQSSIESEQRLDAANSNKLEILAQCNKTFEKALMLIDQHSNIETAITEEQPSIALAIAQCSHDLHNAIELIENEAQKENLSGQEEDEISDLQTLAVSARELQFALLQVEEKYSLSIPEVKERKEVTKDVKEKKEMFACEKSEDYIFELEEELSVSQQDDTSFVENLALSANDMQRELKVLSDDFANATPYTEEDCKKKLNEIKSKAKLFHEGLQLVENQALLSTADIGLKEQQIVKVEALAKAKLSFEDGLQIINSSETNEIKTSSIDALKLCTSKFSQGLQCIAESVFEGNACENLCNISEVGVKVGAQVPTSFERNAFDNLCNIAEVNVKVDAQVPTSDSKTVYLPSKIDGNVLKTLATTLHEMIENVSCTEGVAYEEKSDEHVRSYSQSRMHFSRSLEIIEKELAQLNSMDVDTRRDMCHEMELALEEIQLGVAIIEEYVVWELDTGTMNSSIPIEQLSKLVQLTHEIKVEANPVEEQVKDEIHFVTELHEQIIQESLHATELQEEIVQESLNANEVQGSLQFEAAASINVESKIMHPTNENEDIISVQTNQVINENEGQIATSIVEELKNVAEMLGEVNVGRMGQLENLPKAHETGIISFSEQEVSTMSTKTDMSDLATLAHSVEEFSRGVATVIQQEGLEADVLSLSDMTSVSKLQALAETARTFYENLAQVDEKTVLEEAENLLPTTVKNAVAECKQSFERGIAIIEKTLLFEKLGSSFSESNEISKLEALAKSAHEFQHGLQVIEQQVLLDAECKSMSDKDAASKLITIAGNVQELQKDLAVMEQTVPLEITENIKETTLMQKEIAKILNIDTSLVQGMEEYCKVYEPYSEPSSVAEVASISDESIGHNVDKFEIKDDIQLQVYREEDVDMGKFIDHQLSSNSDVFAMLQQELQDQPIIEHASEDQNADIIVEEISKHSNILSPDENILLETGSLCPIEEVTDSRFLPINEKSSVMMENNLNLKPEVDEMEEDAQKKQNTEVAKLNKDQLEVKKEAEEAECKNKEIEEIERLEAEEKKKSEEAERKKKGLVEIERLEAEEKKKVEEAKRKKKELEEKQKLEAEEETKAEKAERKNKELEEKERLEVEQKKKFEEAERKKKKLEEKQNLEAEEKKKAEEAERKKLELEEMLESEEKKKAEEAERKKKDLEEKQKLVAEEKMKAEEAERIKKELEEKLEAEEKNKAANTDETERIRKESEEKERFEAEEKKKADEVERKKKESEVKQRLDKKKNAEEAERKKMELEEKQKLEAEEKKKAEEAERKKKELKEKQKIKAEEKKKTEEAERLQKNSEEKHEAEEKKKIEEAEQKRKESEQKEKLEAEEKKKAEEAERKKKELEEKLVVEEKKKLVEAERIKKELEEKQKFEAEEKRKAEEAERKKKELEAKQKLEAEEKKKAEEAERKKKELEEKQKLEAEEKNKAEEVERKKKESEEKQRLEAEEKKKAEEAERKKKELEEKQKLEAEEKKKIEETERKKKELEEKQKFLLEEKKEAEEAERKKKELEAKQKLEAEEKKKAEEAERKKKELEEKQKLELEEKNKAEEVERKKKESEEKQKLEAEEKKKAEEAESKKKELEEKIKLEEEEKKKAEEAERKKKEIEEKQKLEVEEKKKSEEAERKKKELEAKRKLEAEEKKKIEEAERKKKELEEKQKLEVEEKKKAEETERKKKELEAKQKLEAEEKKKAVEAERKKKELEEKQRLEAEEKKKAEEAERKMKELEEKIKLEAEEKKKAEEAERNKKELEEKQKIEAEEKKKVEETERKKKELEEKQKLELEEKKKAEETVRKKKELEEKTKLEAEEKKKVEETERKKKELEEKQKLEVQEKKKAEEAERKKKELEAKQKLEAEEKKNAEEAERKKKELEEKQKLEAEEKKKLEETERKKKELEEKQKLEVEEKKKVDEAERKKKELKAKQKLEAEEKKKAEEAERKKKELEEKQKLKAEEKKKVEETERKKKELEEKQKLEVEEKKKDEEAERKKKELEAKQKLEAEEKKKSEEAERKKKELEEKQKLEAEEKKKVEEVERKKKELEEQQKLEAEEKKKVEETERKEKELEAKQKLEAEEKKKAEEAERKKKELEEKQKLEAEEKKKLEETERKKKELEEKQKLEVEEKKKVDEAERKKKELEAKQKLEAEEKKKAEEAERKKKELEEKQKLEAEEKKKVEEVERKKKELEAKQKLEAGEKKKAEEAERKKKELEEKQKLEAEEKKKVEEVERKKKELEEQQKLEAEEKKKVEETERKEKELEETKKLEAEEKRKAEEAERKKKEFEEKHKLEAEQKKKVEEAELKKKELEEQQKLEVEVKKKAEEAEHKKKELDEKETLEAEHKKKAKETERKKKELEEKQKLVVEEKKKLDEDQCKKKEICDARRKSKSKKSSEDIEKVETTNDQDTKSINISQKKSSKKLKSDKDADKKSTEAAEKVVDESKVMTYSATTTTRQVSKEKITPDKPVEIIQTRSTKSATMESSAIDMAEIIQVGKDKEIIPDVPGTAAAAAKQSRKERDAATDANATDDTKTDHKSEHITDYHHHRKPQFCTRLTDRTAEEGSKIKLTCSVLGIPDPTVEWKCKDQIIKPRSSPRIVMSYNDNLATLEIRDTKIEDSGEYSCIARNELGEAITKATLKIYKDVYHPHSDELVLECRLRLNDTPSVTWLKDGIPMVPNDRIQQEVVPDPMGGGALSCRLILASPTATDSEGKPRITSGLKDHEVPAGATIELQVEIKGVPKPDVVWLHDNATVPPSPKIRTYEEKGLYTLTVVNASPAEAGLYTCRAFNPYGRSDTHGSVRVIPRSGRLDKPAMFAERPDTTQGVAVGEDIVISFRICGEPRPQVTWMKGTRDITSSQRVLKETVNDYVRLTLKRALASDAGTYCILARNLYGFDSERDLSHQHRTALKMKPPTCCGTFATRKRNVLSGKPKAKDAAPVIAYRVDAWLIGGGATWEELGITPINSFDAFSLKAGGEYKFRVTPRNRYGWGESVTTSETFTVGRRVELPEFVRILPGQQKVLNATDVRLECEVRAQPSAEVRWYLDGAPIENVASKRRITYDGARCVLTIKNVQFEDSGRYMCEASNKAGRVSTFARFLVVSDPKIMEADQKLRKSLMEEGPLSDAAPHFSMRLRDRRVQLTYPVRLTCQVTGQPTPKVTWHKDGEAIKLGDRYIASSSELFHTLELSGAREEDSGVYSATACNELGGVSCRCRLVVDKGIRAYIAPVFLTALEDMDVKANAEIRLMAHVEAYPAVGITWHRDGIRLRPSRRIEMSLDHEGHVELVVTGAVARDSGVYTCTAVNEVGRAECSARIDVIAPQQKQQPPQIHLQDLYSKEPRFVTKPRSSEAVEGDTVIILCEVIGDPKPEVWWLRDFLRQNKHHSISYLFDPVFLVRDSPN
ncbi:hypothetical protein B566_EDAN007408 [Ephemera danica]|nr:hypothetical protein B566_EDAN007408 [Ephemera danica]